MKLVFLITVLLQLTTLLAANGAQDDKGCNVVNSKKIRLVKDTPLTLTFFKTTDDDITLQIFFEGRKQYENNDLLTLNPYHQTNLLRERDGDPTTENINLKKPIPNGWNAMAITQQSGNLHIGDFHTLTDLEYTVNEISFAAKYLTDCENRTPSWNVGIKEEVEIPINGLSLFSIDLISVYQFQPVIVLNTLDIPLSYEGELIVKKSNALFPPNSYKLLVGYSKNTVSVSFLLINYALYPLMNFTMKEDLMTLKLESITGSFRIIFDPFPGVHIEEEAKISLQSTEIQYTQETTESSECSAPRCQDDLSSCYTWKVATYLTSAIAVILFFFCIYFMRKNFTRLKPKKIDMEEGEEGTPLLLQLQDSLKQRIKASSMEELVGSISKEEPYKKDIFKIKLNPDILEPNKNKIGEFDSCKPTKVILVVGQTASGKSSFINAIINIIYGVEYNDTFRFKLIENVNMSCSTGVNSTENITSYYIPYHYGMKNACNFIFIDTPGFGDIRGISEDKKWNNRFKEFLKSNPDINKVDSICFLIKATDTRLTISQKYIIDGLFSMFGKDIRTNIIVVVSYSDDSKTHVPELLQDSGLDFKLSINFNSAGLYNDKTITTKSPKDIETYFEKNWDMNMKGIDKFLDVLMNIPAVSLTLTNIVLEENKDIELLKDELLELRTMEKNCTDQERESIQSRLEQNQELLMIKLDEAEKLSGRLENIPAKKNPLVINDYIDRLIKGERNENKILELKELKERNEEFQKLMEEKKTTKSLVNYFFLGEKAEKNE